MTYVSSLTCSVLMSKFIQALPGVDDAAGSLTRGRHGRWRLAKLLQPLPHPYRERIVRRELEEMLVSLDRLRHVAGRLSSLGELRPRIRVARRRVRNRFVLRKRIVVCGLHRLVLHVRARLDVELHGLVDRIEAPRVRSAGERLPELGARVEPEKRRRQRCTTLRLNRIAPVARALGALEVQRSELGGRLGVLRPQLLVLLERRDCLVVLALGLAGGREQSVRLRVLRILRDPVARLVGVLLGRVAAAEEVEVPLQQVAEAAGAGADAEQDEAEAEDEREEDEHPPRLPAELREEHVLFGGDARVAGRADLLARPRLADGAAA